ncbi:biotin--[acetyl-CoA-carboxylase] ligase [Neolewinella sp.]|uniref:biotin--[acetyl-CoA-carboxylase] ligase n=1 Tax=Neolewinella sp. TaxID=2993543 RepID=UPI003B5240A3
MLVPKVARAFSRVASTNLALLQDLSTGAPPPHGAVYTTYSQSAGRGQGSNHWHSSPGANLTLSLLLRPDRLTVNHLLALMQFVALAVADTVAVYLPTERICLKWPNDVYVGRQKIAGILLQNGLRGTQVQWAVAGIGLNVNERDFPEPLARSATSLSQHLGKTQDLAAVQTTLFDALSARYELLATRRYSELHGAYQERLYRRGEWVDFTVTATGERLRARVEGVVPNGRLLVRTGDTTRQFAQQEVRWLV